MQASNLSPVALAYIHYTLSLVGLGNYTNLVANAILFGGPLFFLLVHAYAALQVPTEKNAPWYQKLYDFGAYVVGNYGNAVSIPFGQLLAKVFAASPLPDASVANTMVSSVNIAKPTMQMAQIASDASKVTSPPSSDPRSGALAVFISGGAVASLLGAALSLSACANLAPEDPIVAGLAAGWATYNAAVSGETVWLESTKTPNPTTVATIAKYRTEAFNALTQEQNAYNTGGDAAVKLSVEQAAVDALVNYLTGQGINVQAAKTS
jgi:hypothetical protein